MSEVQEGQTGALERARKHLFTYKDVLRIVRKVEPHDGSLGELIIQLDLIWATVLAALSDLYQLVTYLPAPNRYALLVEKLAGLMSWLFDIVSLIVEWGGTTLIGVVEMLQHIPVKWREKDGS